MDKSGPGPFDIEWPDAKLVSLFVDYEIIRVIISPEFGRGSGSPRLLIASGYIGYQLVGMWDDRFIEGAEISADHPFTGTCLAALADRGVDRIDSGSDDRNARTFKTLSVDFQDGSSLLICASRFLLET